MPSTRPIGKIFKNKPTVEGAGVRLKRVFGFNEVPLLDPFLLLDDFRSENTDDYIKGFPWHPHRGIETITYVLAGEVEHGDSLGNEGIISSGDVQWMTAGSGIIHQEMPRGDEHGRMYGFQLWANLPARDKMMTPLYREVKNDQIPVINYPDGKIIKIIAGEVAGIRGPVQDIVIDPEYIDVTLPANTEFIHPVIWGNTVFAYIIEGEGYFGSKNNPVSDEMKTTRNVAVFSDPCVNNGTLVLFADGDEIRVFAENQRLRFLLISGKPIGEQIAWHGPIVMNSQEELNIAFREYQEGTFIK
jgi:quercetin 2,3-dioxygenase